MRLRKTSEGSELLSSHPKAAEPGLKLAPVKPAVSHNSQVLLSLGVGFYILAEVPCLP